MFQDVLDCGLMIPKDGILTLLKSGEKLGYLQFLDCSQNPGSKPKDIHALGEMMELFYHRIRDEMCFLLR